MADIEETSRATEEKDAEPQAVPVGEDTSLKGGRNRICKQCKFTCKDSREFSQHQLVAHGESEETRRIQTSVYSKDNSNNNNNINSSSSNSNRRISAKSHSPLCTSYTKPDFPVNYNLYKMSREDDDENTGDQIYRDTEDDELDDRLVIAEEQDDSFSHTPIRSGNIQNRTYICPFCDFSSTSAKVFLHHQKDIHGKDFTIYECDVCDYATRYKQKLPRHRKLHFPGLEFGSSSASASGPLSLTGESTQDTSDIIATEVDIKRKLDEELEDELDDEEMEIGMDDGIGNDDSQKQKTKRTRQEVDPAKYVEVMDEVGIKYSCSKCGNIYKWRKSLNKHWKEKHADEKLDYIKQTSSPHNLLKHGPTKGCHEMIRRESCEKIIYKKEIKPNGYADDGTPCNEATSGVSDCVMPKMIGPFVTNSYVPVYSTENSQSSTGQPGTDQGALDLSSKTPTTRSSNTQREPIDFSFKKEPCTPTNGSEMIAIKAEPVWDEETNPTDSSEDQKHTSPVLQCPKCAFVAKTSIDYGSHIAVHLNKRAFKCAECQQHFNCIEELNKHFAEAHIQKIQEHRDVVQKIPHGLQQTYHLLRMPLSSNEFNCSENRQLKCSRCDFVAKWPAELQKHAVSHSEERPFICMVCGSTYKWKWDLVKHFEKSHSTLTNPYKRRPTVSGTNGSCEATPFRTANALVDNSNLDSIILPPRKKRRLSETDLTTTLRPFYLDKDKPLDSDPKNDSMNSCEISLQNNRCSPPLMRERPSSVPAYFNDIPEKNNISERDSDGSSMSGLQITNVYSLVKDKTLNSQSDSLECSPILGSTSLDHQSACSDQHRAVNAALRQRINMSSTRSRRPSSLSTSEKDGSCADILLPYKCTLCQYRARWPSEITQHMKNHSDEKPFCCPECSYKSKWKWDVVKHMKRCGGGTVKDVIDNSKLRSCGPPNVVIAVREEPEDSQLIPKPPNSSLLNGEDSQMSFKNTIVSGRMSTPCSLSLGPTTTTPPVDHRPKPQSIRDIRRDSNPSRQNPVFRGLVNDGLYHCLECQFVGHSPAELKRHAYLHSEDKPYVCEVCSYSSRWKCDLKKHIRTYNHHVPANSSQSENCEQLSSSPTVFGQDSIQQSSTPQDPEFFKCNQCSFETNSKLAFNTHLDYHKRAKEPAKQSCPKCDFVSNDSSAFLQHKTSHDTSNSTPSAPVPSSVSNNAGISSRTRHLKNCRKPMKQFRCSKCPYVCLTSQDMVVHEERHKPQGSNAFQCFYCDFSVLQKIHLIHHLYLHPEFDPSDKSKLNEILHFSQLHDVWHANEDNEEIDMACDDSFEYYSESGSYDMYKGKSDSSDCKKDEKEMFLMGDQETPAMNGVLPKTEPSVGQRLQCEWCEAAFVHISTLYQHARSVHPILLRQQEYENNIKYDYPPPPNYNGVAVSQNSAFNPILPKIAQTPKKVLPNPVIKPKKNPSPGKTGGPFKCQKCPFIGASSNTYSRHMERHGSNCKHTCLYCDYSIDRLNLLHQHMRGSHNHDVKQSPLNSSTSDKATINGSHKTDIGSRVILTTPTYIQKSDGTSEPHLRLIAPKPMEGKATEISPTLPILENGPNGKYLYRCPTCSFTSSKVANTSAHIRTHYMTNNLMDNKKNMDKGTDIKYISYSSSFVNKKSNSKPDNAMNMYPVDCDCGDISDQLRVQQSFQVIPKNTLLCLQCPYKTASKESLHEHQEMHGYKGQYRCSECNYSVDHINLFCDHSALHTANNHNSNNYTHNNDNNNNINNSINNNNSNNSNTSQVEYRSCATSQNKVNLHKPFGGVQFRPKFDNERRSKLNIQQMLKQVKMTGRVRYKCSRCPYRTCCKNNIIKHRKQHIVNSRYKCQYCNYSAARKYLLQQHLKFHRNDASEQEKEFQDVVLDPYDENSVKNLKDTKELTVTDKHLPAPQKLTQQKFDETNTKGKPQLPESISVPTISFMKTEEYPDPLQNENKNFFDEQNSEKSRNFKCNHCPFSSNAAFEYRKHSQLHNTQLKYSCDFCSYSVDRLNLLTQHRRLHAHLTNFNPTIPAEALLNMEFVSTPDNMYPTMIPPKDNGRDRELKLSSPNEQVTNSENFQVLELSAGACEETMRYQCKLCPYMSNSLKTFNVHSRMHGLKRKYKCDYCNWSADRLNLLNQHRKVHAREADFDPNPDELTFLNREAALQMKEFISEVKYANKNKSVDGRLLQAQRSKKIHSCKMCPFSCNNKSAYNNHIGFHRTPARFRCTRCSYSIDQWNLLQQHEKTHFPQSEEHSTSDGTSIQMIPKTNLGSLKARLRCPKCPYHCHAQHLLDTHIRMHEAGERNMCNYCEYSTENWEALQKHMEIHNGRTGLSHPSSELECERDDVPENVCNNENALTMDYDENDSEDEYSCDQCSFTTMSIEERRHHESQHEDVNDTIACIYCQFTCTKETEMEDHMTIHQFNKSYVTNVAEKSVSENEEKCQENPTEQCNHDAVVPVTSEKVVTPSYPQSNSSPSNFPTDSMPEVEAKAKNTESSLTPKETPATEDVTSMSSVKLPPGAPSYVCQYCEREFDDEDEMQCHEKRHYKGYENFEAVQ